MLRIIVRFRNEEETCGHRSVVLQKDALNNIDGTYQQRRSIKGNYVEMIARTMSPTIPWRRDAIQCTEIRIEHTMNDLRILLANFSTTLRHLPMSTAIVN